MWYGVLGTSWVWWVVSNVPPNNHGTTSKKQDRVLGIEGFKRYNRAEISALVEVQQELSCEDVTNLPLVSSYAYRDFQKCRTPWTEF